MILITGTNPRANDYVTDLSALNLPVRHCPALTVETVKTRIPDGEFDSMVVTSPHAISNFLPKLPVIAVGAYTTKLLSTAGYDVIQTGTGGIQDLYLSPYESLLYPCAEKPSCVPDNCTPWPIYKTTNNPDFHIADDDTYICVFSARAADIVKSYDLSQKTILCFSDTIADGFQNTDVQKLAVSHSSRYDDMISLILKETKGHT